MNVREDGAAGKPDDPHHVPAHSIEWPRPTPVEPVGFFKAMTVNATGAAQGVVFPGPTGSLTDHEWCPDGTEYGDWASQKATGRKPAYMTMAAFDRSATQRYRGRTTYNVVAMGGFWFDIEGSPKKYAKPNGPESGYANQKEALAAVVAFIKATDLLPNFLVETGSGGLHLHFILLSPIPVAEWQGRAQALVKLATDSGLKIDVPVTTDAARIMRAPGSLHQDTGKEVKAYRLRSERYTVEEWDALTDYAEAAESPGLGAAVSAKRENSINGDVLRDHPPFSYKLAAQHCGAMRKAAEDKGRDTSYPVWFLALGAAKVSVEGEAYAHEISKGHSGYDESETNKKLGSFTGGPASCAAWRSAYGPGGPCDSCEFGEF